MLGLLALLTAAPAALSQEPGFTGGIKDPAVRAVFDRLRTDYHAKNLSGLEAARPPNAPFGALYRCTDSLNIYAYWGAAIGWRLVFGEALGGPNVLHNDLTDLQGGSAGPPKAYYHLSAAQHTGLTGLVQGDVVYGGATGVLAGLAYPVEASRVLQSGASAAANPVWSANQLFLNGDLTAESASLINQDVTTDAQPTWAGAYFNGIINFRMRTTAQTYEGISLHQSYANEMGAYSLHSANEGAKYPIRIALASDAVTHRWFQVGYYTSDNDANAFNPALELDGYNGNLTTYGTVAPNADSQDTLGTSALYWSNVFADRVTFNSTAYLDGTVTAGKISGTGILEMTSSSTGAVTGIFTSALTNTYSSSAYYTHRTTGTAVTGFGEGWIFWCKDQNNAADDPVLGMYAIQAQDARDASSHFVSDLVLKAHPSTAQVHDVLRVTHLGVVRGQIQSPVAPTYSELTDTDTGFGFSAANTADLWVGGNNYARLNSSGDWLVQRYLGWLGDTDTYLTNPAADQVQATAGGALGWLLKTNTGDGPWFGVGVTPTTTLHAYGSKAISEGQTLADGYAGAITSQPVYTKDGAVGTVTRHNYLNLLNPVSAANLTNAAVFRFDAAVGTHKATASNGTVAVTITSVGPTGAQTTIQGWFKINVNGTIRYVPFW